MKDASVPPAVNQVRAPIHNAPLSASRPHLRAQIEFHPYVAKSAEPLSAYGGLTPIVRHKDGPLDAVLAKIRESRGGQVTDAQLLFKWANQRGIVVITFVPPSVRRDRS
jgi:diketogulonate reductase-like aldo/keto reductase